MTKSTMILAVVSGSFHRHMSDVAGVVQALTDLGVHVISPADPRVVAAHGDFLFVASDRSRAIRLVQDRHLEAIRASDFLWLVCPDGYVGQSASMELGYAVSNGVPVYASALPSDLTLRHYVTKVPSLRAAVEAAVVARRDRPHAGFMVDPHASIAEAHEVLETMRVWLSKRPAAIDDAVAGALVRDRKLLNDMFRTHDGQ
jgi:nucleoside 2-deoxyribosyltransferase